MNTTKPIQIFKPGKHTAMSGAALSFSESDLQSSAAAYDPEKHEAPLVVGHPKHDAPAYGWVKGLSFADGVLDAEPDQVDEAFAEMVAAGRFKKISASFYTPDSPQNPVPGVYYLRHVGFLGAQPPAVKGLRAPEFADNEEGVVEFSDWDDVVNAGLWRRLRDFFIEQFGLDKADQVIPDYSVGALEEAARQEPDEVTGLPQFSEIHAPAGAFPAEPKVKENHVTPEEKAALEAENAQLKKQLAESEARDKASKSASLHAAHTDFAEGLIKDGKLLPAQKDVAVATLDFLGGQETVVEFGEGETKKPLLVSFKEFLSAMPKKVEFAEVVKPEGENTGIADFAAAPGYTVDTGSLETHKKALAYQESNKVDYITAVKAVSGE